MNPKYNTRSFRQEFAGGGDQIVNILGFANYRAFIAAIQLCCCSAKAATDNSYRLFINE